MSKYANFNGTSQSSKNYNGTHPNNPNIIGNEFLKKKEGANGIVVRRQHNLLLYESCTIHPMLLLGHIVRIFLTVQFPCQCRSMIPIVQLARTEPS